MGWYHLSFKKDLTAIVKTDGTKDTEFIHPTVPKWIINLKPDDLYKEPDSPPRISVAPSVWQCVAGFGRAEGNPIGTVYIYEVHTPIISRRSFNSVETVITDEQWITDDIISEKIPIAQIGYMVIDKIFLEIKKVSHSEAVLHYMKSIDERETIWSIQDEKFGEKQWELNLDAFNEILHQ